MARTVKYLKGKPLFETTFAFALAANGDTTSATTSRVQVSTDEGYSVVFRGSFTVNGLQLTGGTMTGFDVFVGSTKVMKGRGYSNTVDEIGNAVAAGFEEFLTFFFSAAKVEGSKAGDDIFVGPGSKVLGNDGNDRLMAFVGGANTLNGGDGDDVLMGNGMSRLRGGDGDDIFAFATPGGADKAKDFKVKDDIVALSPDLFGPGWQVGFLDDAQFRKGKAAKTPDQIVLYEKQTGAIYVDRDGSLGAAVPVQVGILPDRLKLEADDIFIGFFL
jgi:Ca2+-binding RTX toxin-like protein